MLIAEAIDSYADRAGSGGDDAAPYNSESLAEIYAPRVRELLDLQGQGFEYAEWKWDAQRGENHWHGVTDPNPQGGLMPLIEKIRTRTRIPDLSWDVFLHVGHDDPLPLGVVQVTEDQTFEAIAIAGPTVTFDAISKQSAVTALVNWHKAHRS